MPKVVFRLNPEQHPDVPSFAEELRRAHEVEVDTDGQTCTATYQNTEIGRRMAQNASITFSGFPGIQAEVAHE